MFFPSGIGTWRKGETATAGVKWAEKLTGETEEGRARGNSCSDTTGRKSAKQSAQEVANERFKQRS